MGLTPLLLTKHWTPLNSWDHGALFLRLGSRLKFFGERGKDVGANGGHRGTRTTKRLWWPTARWLPWTARPWAHDTVPGGAPLNRDEVVMPLGRCRYRGMVDKVFHDHPLWGYATAFTTGTY
jgi:hypothetical protein